MNSDIYQEAKNRVKQKKKFRSDLSSYIVWGGAMLFINLFITRGYMWSLWVIFFWGLGILKQAIDVYGFPWGGSDDWEEKEIQKEMERIKRLGDGADRPTFDSEGEREIIIEDQKTNSKRASWNDDELV